MSLNEISLNISIKIPEIDVNEFIDVHKKRRMRRVSSLFQKKTYARKMAIPCNECDACICWCIIQTSDNILNREQQKQTTKALRVKRKEELMKAKMEERDNRIKRNLRMKELRAEHSKKIEKLKANPMSWIESPYMYGRFELLFSIMREREAFAHITEDQIVSLMPAYAVWLLTAHRTINLEYKHMNCNKIVKIKLNRLQLMNNFVDTLEQNDI